MNKLWIVLAAVATLASTPGAAGQWKVKDTVNEISVGQVEFMRITLRQIYRIAVNNLELEMDYEARVSYLGSVPLQVQLDLDCLSAAGRQLLDTEKRQFRPQPSCRQPVLVLRATYASKTAVGVPPPLVAEVAVIVEPLLYGLTTTAWRSALLSLGVTLAFLYLAWPFWTRTARRHFQQSD